MKNLTPAQARRRDRKIERRQERTEIVLSVCRVIGVDAVGPLLTVPISQEQLDDAAAAGWLGGER